MGRTKRVRSRKRIVQIDDNSLNSCPVIIDLKKWLKRNEFTDDPQLLLKEFNSTGRGVYCKMNLIEGDILIRVPYNLMITYTTLNASDLVSILNKSNVKLEMQDMLSLFLSLERKKSNSFWKIYIDSLPNFQLPLCSIDDVKYFDLLPENLRCFTKDWRRRFDNSWKRVCDALKSIKNDVDFDLYKWSYTMVNTRAVYVDPDIVSNITKRNASDIDRYLIDEPSMALCPFLDMFNHENSAKVDVNLTKESQNDNNWIYTLRTLTPYKKYNQIFINYGTHSNKKLWLEYGFFLKNNDLDSINFDLNADILNVLIANERQYKFIKKHALMNDINLTGDNMSFNLKATLYVLLKSDTFKTWNTTIFNDNYAKDDLNEMRRVCLKLLRNKLIAYKNDLIVIEQLLLECEIFKSMFDLLMNTIEFVERTIQNYHLHLTI